MTILDNYLRIKSEVEVYNDKKIVVVSKGQSIDKIKPLLESGHVHFGENRVQEAIIKWKDVRSKFNNVKIPELVYTSAPERGLGVAIKALSKLVSALAIC